MTHETCLYCDKNNCCCDVPETKERTMNGKPWEEFGPGEVSRLLAERNTELQQEITEWKKAVRAWQEASDANVDRCRALKKELTDFQAQMAGTESIREEARVATQRNEKLQYALAGIATGNRVVQCLDAHLYEYTYECNVQVPCTACLARTRVEHLQAVLSAVNEFTAACGAGPENLPNILAVYDKMKAAARDAEDEE